MKRIPIYLLLVMMVTTLVGCGGNSNKGNDITMLETQDISSTDTQIQESEDEKEKDLDTELDTAPSSESYYEDVELQRAVTLGIGKYRDGDETVTSKEFMEMLDRVVELADEKVLDSWKQRLPEARNSAQSMTRADGMFALFCAAESLGPDYMDKNIGQTATGTLWEKMGNNEGTSAIEYNPNHDLFPWELQEQAPAILFNPQDDYEDRRGDALVYSFSRKSLYSGKTVFDYEEEQNSMRTADPLLYTEALLAALRLHDSALMPEYTVTDTDRQILDTMDARREAICNSLTEVEITGQSYYVSADGNDQNDGLSAQTPWATLEKVSDANLRPGDGVFFKRGDVWRYDSLALQSGVTYSAYGEGEKPCILGSPENGSGAEKWSLLPGTDNIWVYYKKIRDVGAIVLDDAIVARKVSPWLKDGTTFVMPDYSDTPFEFTKALTENLDFYSEDVTTLSGKYNDLEGNVYGVFPPHFLKEESTLYFRCDAGNPGELYDSIEFNCLSRVGLIWPKDLGFEEYQPITDVVLDNLCVKYSGNYGVVAPESITIQNCEIGWIGGALGGYEQRDEERPDLHMPTYAGNCIGNSEDARNTVIRNNLLYQAYDSGISNELLGKDGIQTGFVYQGNLIEYCLIGIETLNLYGKGDFQAGLLKDFVITDNIIAYTGMGWGNGGYEYRKISKNLAFYIRAIGVDVPSENVMVSDNVFYLSSHNLVSVRDENVDFTANTYVQSKYAPLILLKNDEEHKELYYGNDIFAGEYIRDVLGE